MTGDTIMVDDDTTSAKGDVVIIEDSEQPDENGVIHHEDGAKTLLLKHPIDVKLRANGQTRDEKYDRFKFRRINGGDLVVIDNFTKDMDKVKQLFMRLTGKPAVIFDLMDAEDITVMGEMVEHFLPQSRRRGKD